MSKKLSDFSTNDSEKKVSERQKSFGAFTFVEEGKYKIDIERVRKNNKVFFATPCYGGMVTDRYLTSMLNTQRALASMGVEFHISTIRNESLITRARNILTAMFLASSCDVLAFIDADIEWDTDSVVRALAHEKDIIAGAYPKKTLPIQYAMNFKFKDRERTKLNIENGLVEVYDASTGFFFIRRSVIEKMIAKFPKLRYRSDSNIGQDIEKHCYALFDCELDKKDNRYLSEDYLFCRRWQEMGGKVWIDMETKLNHCGSHVYEGNVKQIIRRQ